jgi:hypothetical protein
VQASGIPAILDLFEVGLNPTTPEQAAGDLILPPMSVPIPKPTHRKATRAPSPPELPPVVLDLS